MFIVLSNTNHAQIRKTIASWGATFRWCRWFLLWRREVWYSQCFTCRKGKTILGDSTRTFTSRTFYWISCHYPYGFCRISRISSYKFANTITWMLPRRSVYETGVFEYFLLFITFSSSISWNLTKFTYTCTRVPPFFPKYHFST